jgi:hypothetical protein
LDIPEIPELMIDNTFHRTMAKIGMLDMLVKNNPDGYFEIQCGRI